MAGIQYCTKQSAAPYYIEAIEQNVYSLEEINYFVYHYINRVYRDFFCEALFAYIDEPLGRPDLAAELRRLAAEDATVQEFIRTFLRDSYYYSPAEISAIAELVTNIDNMTKAERFMVEADQDYKTGRYHSALRMYLRILSDRECRDMSETFYARINYSVGLIYARLLMCRNANAYFSHAYELYPDPTYIRACIYMSIISGDDEELLKTIIRFHVTDDTLSSIRKEVDAARREIENSEAAARFDDGLENSSIRENAIANWKEEYYNMLS